MKHFATALLGFGIMLAALPTARAADTICVGDIDTTVNGNLVVPQGQLCNLGGNGSYVTVTGNVQVQTNAQLYILFGATIDGNLDVGAGASLFWEEAPWKVDGNIEANQCLAFLSQAPPDGIAGPIIVGGNVHIQSCLQVQFTYAETNEIGGNFTCSNSNCSLEGMNVNGGVQFINNSGASVYYNTIGGNLQCKGNGYISGSGNTVGGHETGQCANF